MPALSERESLPYYLWLDYSHCVMIPGDPVERMEKELEIPIEELIEMGEKRAEAEAEGKVSWMPWEL